MKRRSKHIISCIMVVALVMTLFPATLFAALSDSQIKDAGGTVYYDADGKRINASSLGGDAVVSLAKTVKGTDTANEFIIDLEVQTVLDIAQVETSADAAVVLVLDISGSMRGQKLQDLKTAAINFLEEFSKVSGNAKRYVSLVTFETNAKIVEGWTDVTNAAQKNALASKISAMTDLGSTYIQGGLQLARNLLSVGAASGISNGSVILFTDGEANCSNNNVTTTSDATVGTVLPGLNASTDGAQTAAAAMAGDIKGKGAKLYTIGFGLSTNTANWLANSVATSPNFAYTAANAGELNKAFATISESIEKWAQAWVVVDPMGENIKFLEALSPGDVNSGLLKFANNTLEWNLKDAKPVASTNTVKTYKYSYRIGLDTKATNFDPDKVYDTNGPTLLNYVMVVNNNIQGDVIEGSFLIPKVKGEIAKEPKEPKEPKEKKKPKKPHKKPKKGHWVDKPDEVVIVPLVPVAGR